MISFALVVLTSFFASSPVSITDNDLVGTPACMMTSLHQQCRAVDGSIIGECNDIPDLALPCDAGWDAACTSAGGSVEDCTGGACDAHTSCSDNNPLMLDCDKDFKAMCRNLGGDFTCDDGRGCQAGTCHNHTVPPP